MLRSYIAFDLETTGLNPEENEIIEIGALKVRDGKVSERFMEFICPQRAIPGHITKITGISNQMVASARPCESVIPEFIDFCQDDILIGHNVIFDYKFMKIGAKRQGYTFEKQGIDTLKIARVVHKEFKSKNLGALCEHYNINNYAAHRAYHDALATAKLYQCLAHFHESKNPKVFEPEQLAYKPKKVLPATKRQIEFLLHLVEDRKLKLDVSPESLTKNEASRMIDRILSGQL